MERKSQRSTPCQKGSLNQQSTINNYLSQNNSVNYNNSCPISSPISQVVGHHGTSQQNTKLRLRTGMTPTMRAFATAAQLQQNAAVKNNPTATGLFKAEKNKYNNNGTATVAGQLLDINAKALAARNKNEEAIQDLRTRIPEIENIFDIKSRIGNGTFSTVLLGTLKKERLLSDGQKRKFAIKHHIPTSHPERIMKELQCMAKIGGSNNVVGINCCIRFNESVAFIMPYMQHDRFQDFYSKMDLPELQHYMKNLLIALRHVHKFNVIHRDVKPSNFLYNRRKRQFLLVDFGLAQQVPLALVQQQLNYETKGITISGNIANNECKRLREADDTNSSIKTDNKVTAPTTDDVGNDAKRQRCTGPQGDHDSSTGSNFKMPLKQINDISNTANNNNNTNNSGNNNNNIKLNENSIINNNNNNNNNAASSSNNPKYNTNRNLSNTNSASKCHCYGNPQVCNTCLVKKEIHASRAGTPGYRPPEVLMKYADQTTAVDVWAAGVILLSILSSVYPFFKANNDFIALAEMVTIFGDKAIRRTAFALDRLVSLSQHTKPLNLRKLCVRFRNRHKFSSSQMLKKHQNADGSCEVCKNCDQYFFNCLCADSPYPTEPMDNDDPFPASAYDLLSKLLEVNPHNRITADEALQHPFFAEIASAHKSTENIATHSTMENVMNSKT